MTAYEIPLTATPQRFQIQLASVLYTLQVRWNEQALSWMLDLMAADGTPILTSKPLITGTDLLKQHAHLGIGGALFVQSDGGLDVVPDLESLGTSGHLYFVTP